MKFRLLLLLLLCPLLALADAPLIEGGVGLGDYKLGNAFETVQQRLGKPPQVKRSPSDPQVGPWPSIPERDWLFCSIASRPSSASR